MPHIRIHVGRRCGICIGAQSRNQTTARCLGISSRAFADLGSAGCVIMCRLQGNAADLAGHTSVLDERINIRGHRSGCHHHADPQTAHR